MCVHICKHPCIQVVCHPTYVYVHVCVCAHACVHVHTYVCVQACVYVFVHVYMHTYVRMYVCICNNVLVCIRTVCTYICAWLHVFFMC